MTTEAKTRKTGKHGRTRSAVLLGLAVGTALAGMVALAGTAREAEAAFTQKIVFSSNRTIGTGVNNPTGDSEIFRMNTDGTGLRQLTTNKVEDFGPLLSPDGTKVTYHSHGIQSSNPEGDYEIYLMNAADGTGKKNLTNNGADVSDYSPVFSPGGTRIAYGSHGKQISNPEGDSEVYRMSALDGSAKKNLSNNGIEVAGAEPVDDSSPRFSPDGTKIAYASRGVQSSNPEGDSEVYRMSALDGSAKKNLSNNGDGVYDIVPFFSSDGQKVFYESQGVQNSNAEGDREIYSINTVDGMGQKNLTNNGLDVQDSIYPD
jgi:Tol biopolymer transport system component